ncbi:DUF5694 domain-containing protein [Empedobacter sp. UBA6745]|uniref:DUF5694 domain-containing protein n=1 Tax=Empedobacter sp. UBA6745 TaxID=1946447 RepID=UPI0025BEEF6E|nr:DUF5694 domain-containing protein [Empedobacter sp. UBA6745]
MKNLFITIITVLGSVNLSAQAKYNFQTKFDDAIPVLNVGTFHMGYTTDANSTEFDEHNKENIRQVHELANKIAAFKPTIILVEQEPYKNKKIATAYSDYLKNPKMKFEKPTEIELLAYEVGRLSGSKKIYGINYQEDYLYMLGDLLKEQDDSITFKKYIEMFRNNESKNGVTKKDVKLKELLQYYNQPEFLDFSVAVNADMLTTVSYKKYPVGAEQAAKYYHRNLAMFSNMNNVPITKDDRIFVLMGATHTAFFKDFLRRSPKFKEVNTLDYLK